MSLPSDTRASLDRLSTPGSGPSIPFRALRTPFGLRRRHFDSVTRMVCCRSRGMSNFPDTLDGGELRIRISARFAITTQNPRSSGQYSAAWDGSSCPQLLRGFPLPHGYPRASSPGRRRMNAAAPVSLSSISPVQRAATRAQVVRFKVRATSRTLSCVCLLRSSGADGFEPCLPGFNRALYQLSYHPVSVADAHALQSAPGTKKARCS